MCRQGRARPGRVDTVLTGAKKNMPMTYVATSPAARWIHALCERMPDTYVGHTTVAEREAHAMLYERMLASHTVEMAWAAAEASQQEQQPQNGTLHIAFVDKPGSLSAITASLARNGINIFNMSAFSTDTGVAIDSFCVSSFDDNAAHDIKASLEQAGEASDAMSDGTRSDDASSNGTSAVESPWFQTFRPRQTERGTASAALHFTELLKKEADAAMHASSPNGNRSSMSRSASHHSLSNSLSR